MVAIVRDPDIGKTRMAQELSTHASLRGAQTLWGRCEEEQGVSTYWPWTQAVRAYLRAQSEPELRDDLGSSARIVQKSYPTYASASPTSTILRNSMTWTQRAVIERIATVVLRTESTADWQRRLAFEPLGVVATVDNDRARAARHWQQLKELPAAPDLASLRGCVARAAGETESAVAYPRGALPDISSEGIVTIALYQLTARYLSA